MFERLQHYTADLSHGMRAFGAMVFTSTYRIFMGLQTLAANGLITCRLDIEKRCRASPTRPNPAENVQDQLQAYLAAGTSAAETTFSAGNDGLALVSGHAVHFVVLESRAYRHVQANRSVIQW